MLSDIINTHIIGRHLPVPTQEMYKLKGGCAFCGTAGKGIEGIPLKKAISTNFSDAQFLKPFNNVCKYCAASLGVDQKRGTKLVCSTFLATPTKLLLLKREDIWQHIMNPPDENFVFGVTYKYKKHISFKAPVNLPGQSTYNIQIDSGLTIPVNLLKLKDAIEIMQKWYTVKNTTKAMPTYLTKDDILFGNLKGWKIDEYIRAKKMTYNQFFAENAILDKHRGTSFLQLLVFALNKKDNSKTKNSSTKKDIDYFEAVDDLNKEPNLKKGEEKA